MTTLTDNLPLIAVGVLAAMGGVFALVHVRYHIKPTQLDSFEALQTYLTKGRYTLVQFYVPL